MRALVACLEAFGGSPKEWVFDNAKILRASPIGVVPIELHRCLRDLVAEYRVIPTFCAPRSGNQKDSVERLVGYAKHSFLFSRRFKDREDLRVQLGEWLSEVNHARRCDATGVVPEVARQEELRWLKERPLITSPSALALRETATVTPAGTVSVNGTPYFATARFIRAPATVFIRQDTIEIAIGDRERCTHARRDGVGAVQRLDSQRTHLLAAIRGRRKQATFRLQCLLETGQEAWGFLAGLVHRCPNGMLGALRPAGHPGRGRHARRLRPLRPRWPLHRRRGRPRPHRGRGMSDAHIDLDALFKRLHLATMRRIPNALEERAAAESWTHREFLLRLLTEEVANRSGTRVKRLSHQAKFPYLKSIEEFDFTFQASLRRQQLGPFLGPEFVTEGRNLILSGAPGRGKTHIAIALAYKAIQNGFEARFVTATALIDALAGAAAAGKLREVSATYVQPHVLVIDEVGYLQHANSAANVLYGVIDQRCLKRRPVVLTTNKALRQWGDVLHDPQLAEALLDRLLERGSHIRLTGKSWRTRGQPDDDLPASDT